MMNKDERFHLLMDTELFRGFSQEEGRVCFEALSPTLRKFSKEQIVVPQGEKLKHIMIVASGQIREEKYFAEGKLHLHSIYGRGGLPGLTAAVSASKVLYMTYTADTRAEILVADVDKLFKLDQKVRIYENIMHILANENIIMTNNVEILTNRGLRDRIVAYFSILKQKSGSEDVKLDMSQEKLANFLCVNRSALSNELNKMKREGLIDFKGRKYKIFF